MRKWQNWHKKCQKDTHIQSFACWYFSSRFWWILTDKKGKMKFLWNFSSIFSPFFTILRQKTGFFISAFLHKIFCENNFCRWECKNAKKQKYWHVYPWSGSLGASQNHSFTYKCAMIFWAISHIYKYFLAVDTPLE